VNETLLDLAPDFRAALERHADRLDLELIESRTFSSRVVYLRYRVAH